MAMLSENNSLFPDFNCISYLIPAGDDTVHDLSLGGISVRVRVRHHSENAESESTSEAPENSASDHVGQVKHSNDGQNTVEDSAAVDGGGEKSRADTDDASQSQVHDIESAPRTYIKYSLLKWFFVFRHDLAAS